MIREAEQELAAVVLHAWVRRLWAKPFQRTPQGGHCTAAGIGGEARAPLRHEKPGTIMKDKKDILEAELKEGVLRLPKVPRGRPPAAPRGPGPCRLVVRCRGADRLDTGTGTALR